MGCSSSRPPGWSAPWHKCRERSPVVASGTPAPLEVKANAALWRVFRYESSYLQHNPLCQASQPSWRAKPTTMKPATGSAHHHPATL